MFDEDDREPRLAAAARDATQGGLNGQLAGWRLATAEILYYMPDHPALLQSFIWQHEDLAPRYPRLVRFLDHWRREIDAVLHSVTVDRAPLIRPAAVRRVDGVFGLN